VADSLVLCYHAVSERWDAALSVLPARFHGQLRALKAAGYESGRFTDVALGRTTGKTVAITFDDAFASVTSLGKPILDELGWTATVFAPTAFMDDRRPLSWPGIDHWEQTEHAPELEPLDWNGLAELQEAGWEIGSHTHSHPHLTTLPDDALQEELERSRALCAQHLGACESIAYPYGDVDPRVVAAARRAGYAAGGGLPERHHAADPLNWPRVGIYYVDDEARAARKWARWSRSLQRMPGWPLVWSAASAARRVVK
jgi:peptidoglycan/xylan/chitin deacetylase (PgdA/CDA1 family)